MKRKTTVFLAGPLPPPWTGQATGVKTLLEFPSLRRQYSVTHIDLSFEGKSRPLRVLLTLRSILIFSYRLVTLRPNILHLIVSRTKLGCVKDLLFIRLAHLARVKCMVHVRGGDLGRFYDDCGSLLKRFLSSAYSKVDCAVALGPSLRSQFDGLVSPEKVSVVPNCYHEDGDHGEFIRRYEGTSGQLPVLFLSNVLPSKGLFDALNGVAIARKRGVPVNFTFAGQFLDNDLSLARSPELRAENLDACAIQKKFDESVKELALDGSVRTLGVVSGYRKWALLWENDILVLPVFNLTEGQPLTVIEAMRAGCVVVSTSCGGLQDLVEDGVTGRVIRPRSPEDIAGALEYFWRNPQDITRIGQANQQLAMERHSPEAHVSRIIDIYEKLLVAQA